MDEVRMPCGALLISDTEDDRKVTDADATEFTHSTVWYCRNSQYLVHRTYLAHFERGLFSLADAAASPATKYMRPFLPERVRDYVENLRVVLVGSQEVETRCLHFPITIEEFKLLVSFIARAKTHGKPSQERLVFAIRSAASAMVGRVGFDAARMVRECSEKNFAFVEEKCGLFTAQCGTRAKKAKPVRVATATRDPRLPGNRVVAMSGKNLYVSHSDEVRIAMLDEKRMLRIGVKGVVEMAPLPNGDVVIATWSGRIVISSFVNSRPQALEAMNIQKPVMGAKVSRGGVPTFAVLGANRQFLVVGHETRGLTVTPSEKIVDYDINNDDCYVATDNCVHYYLAGEQVMSWDIRPMYEQDKADRHAPIKSLCMDPMTMSIGVCTEDRCYLVDPRMPRVIGAADFRTPGKILSYHPSQFMDIGVILHSNGFATVDVRKPEAPMSKFSFAHQDDLRPLGQWISGSRLFAMTVQDKFLIACPYLREPVLEAYDLPKGGGIVQRIGASLDLAYVHQPNRLTVFGMSGVEVSVPSLF